ncbi:hypothetical protein [uncultured Psychroserpens sp.]|uniref:hypothetical protein n=1 Tax=uncultured Psychroserpens sp. TaxID=255436 RepID=UPI00261DA9A1|nr:hypothetical protein [uncultured Psychroserpens sp.]
MKISTYIFSICFTSLLLFNAARVTLTYAYYEYDPIGFIEALCENQDKPELACNGKCQLMKVSESQNKDQNTPEGILDFKELILYQNSPNTTILTHKEWIKKQTVITYQSLYSYISTYVCFHPPRV